METIDQVTVKATNWLVDASIFNLDMQNTGMIHVPGGTELDRAEKHAILNLVFICLRFTV